MGERTAYNVAAITPFWRYAVALEHRPDLPAIPFFRKASACVFYDESASRFNGTVLLKRRPFGRVVEVRRG